MLGPVARLGHTWTNAAVQRYSFEMAVHERHVYSLRQHCADLRRTIRHSRVNTLGLVTQIDNQSTEAKQNLRRLTVTAHFKRGDILESNVRPSKRFVGRLFQLSWSFILTPALPLRI